MLVANICSIIGMILLLMSTFSKTKKGILKFQIGDATFNSLANLLVHSYSGAITCFIALVRNMLIVKGKLTKSIGVILVLSTLVIGLVINSRGFIGLLPILASVSYGLLSWLCKSPQSVRWALVLNLTLWGIHDIYVGLYFAFIVDCVIIVVTLVNIVRLRKKV